MLEMTHLHIQWLKTILNIHNFQFISSWSFPLYKFWTVFWIKHIKVGASSQCYWNEQMLLKRELMLYKCQIDTNTNKNGFLHSTKCLERELKYSFFSFNFEFFFKFIVCQFYNYFVFVFIWHFTSISSNFTSISSNLKGQCRYFDQGVQR